MRFFFDEIGELMKPIYIRSCPSITNDAIFGVGKIFKLEYMFVRYVFRLENQILAILSL